MQNVLWGRRRSFWNCGAGNTAPPHKSPNQEGENLRKQQSFSQSLIFYFCFLLLPTAEGWGHPSAWVYIFWVATTNNDCRGFHRPASTLLQFSSVQFSRSVSDSLQPHESQHARPPCPSPTPGVYSNSCPSSRWCHPTISSSVVPFSSRLQSFPAPGSFQMSELFASGSQSIGVAASASVLPMHIQDWSPLGWTGWMSLQSKGLSRVFSNTTIQKHQFFLALSLLYSPVLTSIHDYWKNHSFD